MTDRELEAELRKATRGSVAGIVLVGGGTGAMGVFAGLCGLFRGDPDMRHYSPPMWLAYAVMVAFFCGVGAVMVFSGLFIVPRKGDDFVDRVLRRPGCFTRLWLLLAKSKYNPADSPGQIGVSTSLCADTDDGKHFQFMVKGAIADALLAELSRRAPQATVGPP